MLSARHQHTLQRRFLEALYDLSIAWFAFSITSSPELKSALGCWCGNQHSTLWAGRDPGSASSHPKPKGSPWSLDLSAKPWEESTWFTYTSPTSVASLQTWSPWLARTSYCVGVQGDMSFSSCQQRHAWILPQRAPKLFTNNYPGEQMFHSLYRFLDIFEFPIVPREVAPGL